MWNGFIDAMNSVTPVIFISALLRLTEEQKLGF